VMVVNDAVEQSCLGVYAGDGEWRAVTEERAAVVRSVGGIYWCLMGMQWWG
jgi:hypothetical protein